MTNLPGATGLADHGTDLTLANVADARSWIDPAFVDTPQYEDESLGRALGRRVVVKVETANPIRSFKARGVGYALRELPAGTTVVCASSGNFGQAVAYVGRARGLRVRVYTTRGVNAAKRTRMTAFGAQVLDAWPDLTAARSAAAEAAAADPALHLITDGVEPAIAEGAATIAAELTDAYRLDSVLVPVGDGSLISGIALWLRAHSPDTRIIGVNPASAPAMQHSYRSGTVTPIPARNEFAEGITISHPHARSLARVRALVDDIVLVNDAEILDAMALTARCLSILPEPAGAAGLAAIAAGHAVGDRVATVITGGNLNPAGLPALLDRLATQGDAA